ncbi:ribonuclease HI [Candidatus Saccharibacteria bacterium]|nr:ribonuclease HI [Candidatus Saccharibacteria bacterium]MBQ1540284.1 ribonuclease HI [Candidatus Saccharibacteria bacterium]
MMILWTDGSASPNPGPGGFAVIEVRDGVGKPVILGREKQSSNIRMEGFALIAAMRRALKSGEPCEIHTDSEFWINVVTKWMGTWAERGWKKNRGEIKNLEIVKELYELYDPELMRLVWVRGHVGTEFNEMADEWANKAREGATL